jgi:phosphoglycolate phosphatase
MQTGIMLDLDGTLIDSRADLALAVNLTREELGLAPIPQAQVVGYVGEGVRKLLTRAIPELPGQLEQALAINQRHYRAHLLDMTTLYPGVGDALARLFQRGARLMVVTNKPRAFTDLILEGLGLAPLMAAVVGGGDCPLLKPDPAPLLMALQLGGCPAEGAWMVGDHFTDLEAGRRAGLKRCFCRYGFGDPGRETWDLAVDDLTELATFLEA